MPRPTRAYGRPGTTALPPGWGASHAPVAAGTRNATVTLSRSTGTGAHWDPASESTTIDQAAPYASAVSARIQALLSRSDNAADAAEETLTEPPYLVTVAFSLDDVTSGDVVTVTACAGDAALVDQTLRVDHVILGTERFERDLLCTLIDRPAS